MTMKFNQGLYAKMKVKKNEPLFRSRGKNGACNGEGGLHHSSYPRHWDNVDSLPTTSIEEIAPLWKKQRVADKGKDKANSCSSSIWDDASLALVRAQEAFISEELRVFSGVSSNKVVGRHLHKLV